MDKQKRQRIIVGNWKMNKTPGESEQLIKSIKSRLSKMECEVVLCVPFIDIHVAVDLTQNTDIKVGAQNCHFEQNGAYTGEISAQMLKVLSVEYVILGHSERRVLFSENDEIINKKVKAALAEGLRVILCVGETERERMCDITEEKVSAQIKKALYGISKKELKSVSIAYEPLWAIGTGKTASKEIANKVCGKIRKIISCMYGKSASEEMSILYGGSVNARNARELLCMENIDGALIGKASLDSYEFSHIISGAQN